jgi:signal transduction histidine kinase/CHASE3 domain sensor protein
MVLVAMVFGVMLVAIENLGDSGREARHSQAVIEASDGMQTLVLDLETSVRGYVLTRQRPFLQPWLAGVRAFPHRVATLERLVRGDRQQERAARAIIANVRAYIRDYSTPLVEIARRDPAGARSLVRAGEGKRRVDTLRGELQRLTAREHSLSKRLAGRADSSGRRAILIGFASLAGVLGVIGLLALYLERLIGAPVRRIAVAAEQLAGGDFAARAPESGVAPVARLGTAFNHMVASLRESARNLERQTVELRAHQASLERLLDVNNAVLNASLDGIRLVDLEGHTVLANSLIADITTEVFGLPAEATLKQRSAIVERLTDPASYLATMTAIEADPECVTQDDFELADLKRSFQRTTRPVYDSSGTLIGRIIVLREITAERTAESLKSELVATVSHELRTPLAGVLGFAELLLDRAPDPETSRSYLETIHSEAQRLTALIDDFLDLQRIEAGRFALASEPFDLVQVVQSEVELFAMQSTKHSLDFTASHAPLTFHGDRSRIAQIVANLLSNAIKYSPAGGTVTITATKQEASLRISVSDPGVGIPRDQQSRVFEKFFRVDSSDTRTIGGTGLGLALCQEIVTAHGGTIGFDSSAGQGSTFWFELPTTHPHTTTQRARAVILDADSTTYASTRASETPHTTPTPRDVRRTENDA